MIDPDCAVCCQLEATVESLEKIIQYIEWSCTGKKSKQDFGLTKSFIKEQVGVIKKMGKWHQYYHSTGESLMETNSELNSNNNPKRWRKP